jgi:hypothetical protein
MNEHSGEAKGTGGAEFLYKTAGLFAHVLTVPLFIILHKSTPDPDWSFQLDRILLFIASFIIVESFFKMFRHVLTLLFIGLLVYLSFGSLTGGYGFHSVYRDYQVMLFSMKDNPNPVEVLSTYLRPFPHKEEIKEAIDYTHPKVRSFAMSSIATHFKDEVERFPRDRKIIQCFAVFKSINLGWNYVNDPSQREYFSKASETTRYLSGDCDDHSIFMVACIKAIGGRARIVNTTNHLYPELFVGSKEELERIHYLIKNELFPRESGHKKINYHVDEQGNVWLNLDYTSHHPGGPFMHSEVLGVLE